MSDPATSIGRGIDVFRFDGSTPPTLGRVVDTSVCGTATLEYPTAGIETTYGSTFAEFASRLAVKAGIGVTTAAFSASVESSFSSERTRTRRTEFARVHQHIGCEIVLLDDDLDGLRRSITDDFRDALERGDPAATIDEYGTHVARKAIVGGYAFYDCSMAVTSETSSQSIAVAAEARYGAIQAHGSVERSESRTSSQLEGGSTINTVGGRASSVVGEPEWKQWAASVEENPQFVGFTEDGLVPIWELVERGHPMREGLRLELLRRMAAHPVVQVFTAQTGSLPYPDISLTLPDGYKMVGGGALDQPDSGIANLLTASFPAGDRTWRACGLERITPSPARLSVYVLALHDPLDLWEVQVFSSEGAGGPQTWPEASVQVPEGYTLVGGGAYDDWSEAGVLAGNFLTASYPDADRRTWRARGKDIAAGPGDRNQGRLRAHALGLRSRVDGVRVDNGVFESVSGLGIEPVATAATDTGFLLTGGGAEAWWAAEADDRRAQRPTVNGQHLAGSHPVDGFTWQASSRYRQGRTLGRVRAFAIGLRVTVE